ncbi:hypothetical protein QR680_015169 [Steinernema hermaphroditum]|uniref:tRNA (uracil-O(2)-)-methyltransferase n=1 Tax=Steinernema hermaphroditum TaxID=289476 RepID=A0AA39IDP2_9BILA|nr:hypothetical protein QR680_015169 [Steinernema hermaphroditum]
MTHEASTSFGAANAIIPVVPVAVRRLFVGNLGTDGDFTDEHLARFYGKFGPLTECRISIDRRTGKSRGFGFVTFKYEHSADKALETLPHFIIDRRVSVSRMKSESTVVEPLIKKMQSKQLYVCHMPGSVAEEQLRAHFSQFGNVVDVDMVRDMKTDETLGYSLISASVNAWIMKIDVKREKTQDMHHLAIAIHPTTNGSPYSSRIRLPTSVSSFSICSAIQRSTDGMWSELVAAVVQIPETTLDKSLLFEKLIDIWCSNVHTVNRRLVGAVRIEPGSEEYKLLEQNDYCEAFRLIPKADIFSAKCYQIVIPLGEFGREFRSVRLDPDDANLKHPHIPIDYRVFFDSSQDQLKIEVPQGREGTAAWLKASVFPNLVRWMKNADENRGKAPHVSLIDIEEYSKTYRRIKATLGKSIVENWSERTDPHKFVYEDCALTAYLTVLFKETNFTPKRFADVGCGNGLLVKLLKEEGVAGVGIDIRKRKIWNEFIADGVELCEATLDPQTVSGMPDGVDYLIGNHSDELTPWIPIMAARMKCNFFLLPCCPFDFYAKYTKVKGASGDSQYENYMSYIRSIIAKLGFEFREDRLRIPSTKRHAFIANIPDAGLPHNIDQIIDELTKRDENFVPRAKEVENKNCSQLPVQFRIGLVKKIFDYLMSLSAAVDRGWRTGGKTKLAELALILTVDEKERLRNQNGGLQTFLKNQHQLFKLESVPPKKEHAKKSECWFLRNHPDGCPLSDDDCRFAH